MAVSRNLVSGNTTMLLLQMLSQKDMYGYEMIETLSERSNNVFELKVGTLYPLLHSLVQSGYLTCLVLCQDLVQVKMRFSSS